MTAPIVRRTSELARNLPTTFGSGTTHLKTLRFSAECVVAPSGTKQFSRR
jgi:hypothetical protein